MNDDASTLYTFILVLGVRFLSSMLCYLVHQLIYSKRQIWKFKTKICNNGEFKLCATYNRNIEDATIFFFWQNTSLGLYIFITSCTKSPYYLWFYYILVLLYFISRGPYTIFFLFHLKLFRDETLLYFI